MERPFQLATQRFSVLESATGCDVARRYNTKLLRHTPLTLGYVAGNALRLHNVQDGGTRTLFASAGAGVGGFALHPDGQVLAVAERAIEGQYAPVIALYSLPSLRRLCILENGTDRAYSDVNFSADGSRLVSVGASPDFSLTVWDLEFDREGSPAPAQTAEAPARSATAAAPPTGDVPAAASEGSTSATIDATTGIDAAAAAAVDGADAGAAAAAAVAAAAGEPSAAASASSSASSSSSSGSSSSGRITAVRGRIMLRTKAFGQDVFACRFSPRDSGRIVTCGSGHIRFWRMAATFTGLKLQGEIGKFGRVDLSDVTDFSELADGKVVSTSEGGYLLLWEGNLIKCQIGRAAEAPPAPGTAPLLALPSGAGAGGDSGRSHGGAAGADADDRGSVRSARSSVHEGASNAAAPPLPPPVLPAHDGPVRCVLQERELGLLLTGGDDGVLRFWDLRDVDAADVTDDAPVPGLVPVAELRLPHALALGLGLGAGAGLTAAPGSGAGAGSGAAALVRLNSFLGHHEASAAAVVARAAAQREIEFFGGASAGTVAAGASVGGSTVLSAAQSLVLPGGLEAAVATSPAGMAAAADFAAAAAAQASSVSVRLAGAGGAFGDSTESAMPPVGPPARVSCIARLASADLAPWSPPTAAAASAAAAGSAGSAVTHAPSSLEHGTQAPAAANAAAAAGEEAGPAPASGSAPGSRSGSRSDSRPHSGLARKAEAGGAGAADGDAAAAAGTAAVPPLQLHGRPPAGAASASVAGAGAGAGSPSAMREVSWVITDAAAGVLWRLTMRVRTCTVLRRATGAMMTFSELAFAGLERMAHVHAGPLVGAALATVDKSAGADGAADGGGSGLELLTAGADGSVRLWAAGSAASSSDASPAVAVALAEQARLQRFHDRRAVGPGGDGSVGAAADAIAHSGALSHVHRPLVSPVAATAAASLAANTMVVGFSDGVLHIITRSTASASSSRRGASASSAALFRRFVVKAHGAPVTALAVASPSSSHSRFLAAGAADGNVFLFAVHSGGGSGIKGWALEPLGFIACRRVMPAETRVVTKYDPVAAAAAAAAAAAEGDGAADAGAGSGSSSSGGGGGGASISAAAQALPVSEAALHPSEMSPVTAAVWSRGGTRLYVGCGDGCVRRIDVPAHPSLFPSAQGTFEMPSLLEGIAPLTGANAGSGAAATAGGSVAASPAPGGRAGFGGGSVPGSPAPLGSPTPKTPAANNAGGGGPAGELQLGPAALFRMRVQVKRDLQTAEGAKGGSSAVGSASGAGSSEGYEILSVCPTAITCLALAPSAVKAADDEDESSAGESDVDSLLVGVRAAEGGSHCLYQVAALSSAALARRYAKRLKAAAAAADLAALLGGGSGAAGGSSQGTGGPGPGPGSTLSSPVKGAGGGPSSPKKGGAGAGAGAGGAAPVPLTAPAHDLEITAALPVAPIRLGESVAQAHVTTAVTVPVPPAMRAGEAGAGTGTALPANMLLLGTSDGGVYLLLPSTSAAASAAVAAAAAADAASPTPGDVSSAAAAADAFASIAGPVLHLQLHDSAVGHGAVRAVAAAFTPAAGSAAVALFTAAQLQLPAATGASASILRVATASADGAWATVLVDAAAFAAAAASELHPSKLAGIERADALSEVLVDCTRNGSGSTSSASATASAAALAKAASAATSTSGAADDGAKGEEAAIPLASFRLPRVVPPQLPSAPDASVAAGAGADGSARTALPSTVRPGTPITAATEAPGTASAASASDAAASGPAATGSRPATAPSAADAAAAAAPSAAVIDSILSGSGAAGGGGPGGSLAASLAASAAISLSGEKDMLTPAAYSLEQDRQRSAADARSRDAEAVKARRRQAVAALRQAFADFRARVAATSVSVAVASAAAAGADAAAAAAASAAAASQARAAGAAQLLLSEAELALDPELEATLHAEGAARLAETDRQWQYDVTRRRALLRKGVRRFLGNLAVAEAAVDAIGSHHPGAAAAAREAGLPVPLAGLQGAGSQDGSSADGSSALAFAPGAPLRRHTVSTLPTAHLPAGVLASLAELLKLAASLAAADGAQGALSSGFSRPRGLLRPAVGSSVPSASGANGSGPAGSTRSSMVGGGGGGGAAAPNAASAALGDADEEDGRDPTSPAALGLLPGAASLFATEDVAEPAGAGTGAGAGASAGVPRGSHSIDGGASTVSSPTVDGEGEDDGPLGSTALFNQRRALRLLRKAALETLASQRPGPGDDFPPDVRAVAWASSHMGDYKLKGGGSRGGATGAGADYRPPRGVRVDAPSKRLQILELDLMAHAARMQFNAAVAALGARRPTVIAALLSAQVEFAAIEAELARGGVARLLAAAGVPPPALPGPGNGSKAAYTEEDFSFELPPLPWLLAGMRGARGPVPVGDTDLVRLLAETLAEAEANLPPSALAAAAAAAGGRGAAALTGARLHALGNAANADGNGNTGALALPSGALLPQSLTVLAADPHASLIASLTNALTPALLRLEVRGSTDMRQLAAAAAADARAASSASSGAAQAVPNARNTRADALITAAASAARLFPWQSHAAWLVSSGTPGDRWSFDGLTAARSLHVTALPPAEAIAAAGTPDQSGSASPAGGSFEDASGAGSASLSAAASTLASPVGMLSGPPSAEEVADALALYALLFDRGLWLKRAQRLLLTAFDNAVDALSRERLRIAVRVSAAAAVRRRVLEAELDLLLELSKRDAAIEGRLAKTAADKASVSASLASHTSLLAERRAELDGLQARERLLQGELEELVGGTAHPAFPALLRIYKRKVKRRPPPGAAKEAKSADGEDSDDSDDLDDEDIGDEDEDEEEDDTAPDGCDRTTFERVLALRERRLDVEDSTTDVNKAIDELRRAAERFAGREKTVDKELTAIMSELAAFQREKQARLNQIDSVAVLRASQIVAGLQPAQFASGVSAAAAAAAAAAGSASPSAGGSVAMEGSVPGSGSGNGGSAPPSGPFVFPDGAPLGQLPGTAGHCVVFNRATLRRLQGRVGELESETAVLRERYSSLHGEERRLGAEKRRLEAEIAAWRTRCEELQVLKFGRVLDIAALDRATAAQSSAAAQIHGELSSAVATQDGEIARVRKRMADSQATLLSLTRQHTVVLEELAYLVGRQAALEAQLSGRDDEAADMTAFSNALGATSAPGAIQATLAATAASAAAAAATGTGSVRGKPPVGAARAVAKAGRESGVSLSSSTPSVTGLGASTGSVPGLRAGDELDAQPSMTQSIGGGDGGSVARSVRSKAGSTVTTGTRAGMAAAAAAALAIPIGTVSSTALNRTLTAVLGSGGSGGGRARSRGGARGAGGLSSLGGSSGIVITDATGQLEADSEDRVALLTRIKSQADEIAALRSEIIALRRKGGLTQLPPNTSGGGASGSGVGDAWAVPAHMTSGYALSQAAAPGLPMPMYPPPHVYQPPGSSHGHELPGTHGGNRASGRAVQTPGGYGAAGARDRGDSTSAPAGVGAMVGTSFGPHPGAGAGDTAGAVGMHGASGHDSHAYTTTPSGFLETHSGAGSRSPSPGHHGHGAGGSSTGRLSPSSAELEGLMVGTAGAGGSLSGRSVGAAGGAGSKPHTGAGGARIRSLGAAATGASGAGGPPSPDPHGRDAAGSMGASSPGAASAVEGFALEGASLSRR